MCPRRLLDGGATAAMDGSHFSFCQMYNTRTPAGYGAPILPADKDSGIRAGPVDLLKALTVSLPIPAPSVPLPIRSSPSRPLQSVISEQSRDAPQTATSLVYDTDVLELSRSRNSVIYLFPPSFLPRVTVELLLTSTWIFRQCIPRPRPSSRPENVKPPESLTWAIAAEPSGTLVEKATGTEVPYLFWEAM